MDNGHTLRAELQSLERKVKMLLNEHTILKGEVDQLRQENSALKDELGKKADDLDYFQNQIKISKIVDHMTAGGGSSTELKDVLDQYIKEIDKCITQLSEI